MIKRRELYRAVADKCDEPIGPTSKICLALLKELASVAYCHGPLTPEAAPCFADVDRLLRDVYREMGK